MGDISFANIEIPILLTIKVLTIIFLVFYLIFAGVIVKQVRVMTEALQVGMEVSVRSLAFLHFIFTLLVLILAIFTL